MGNLWNLWPWILFWIRIPACKNLQKSNTPFFINPLITGARFGSILVLPRHNILAHFFSYYFFATRSTQVQNNKLVSTYWPWYNAPINYPHHQHSIIYAYNRCIKDQPPYICASLSIITIPTAIKFCCNYHYYHHQINEYIATDVGVVPSLLYISYVHIIYASVSLEVGIYTTSGQFVYLLLSWKF